MISQQQSRMLYDPATGIERPYPSHADQWREYNGTTAWLFDPWTGERRGAGVVGNDTFGRLIIPPGEPVQAAASVDAARKQALTEAVAIAEMHRARIPNHDPDDPREDLVAQGYGNAAINIAVDIRRFRDAS